MMGQHGHRNMFYATGLPGWMRFGYSPGWGGMPPGAQYLQQTGQLPQAVDWFSQQTGTQPVQPSQTQAPPQPGAQPAPSQQAPPQPAYPTAPQQPIPGQPSRDQEIQMLESQLAALENQIGQIRNRIEQLRNQSR